MDRMDQGGPFWNRIAAATGLDFVATGIVIAVLAQVKDFENSSDFIGASNEVWGVYALMLGFAATFFLWFTSIFVARLRQVEAASGTSGRLANAVAMSGAVFSGSLVLALASQWAARQLGASQVGELSTAVLEGPVLGYVIAVYIGAAGLTIVRAGAGVSAASRRVAQLSLLVAPAFLALDSIQIFNNYAWIDETGYIMFLLWVLAVSVIGLQRWGAIDDGYTRSEPAAADEIEPIVAPEPLAGPERAVTASRPAARKPAARKPAARKKAAAKRPAARKKPAPRR
jgi:hypothetical protein